jgi:hypothetical protein
MGQRTKRGHLLLRWPSIFFVKDLARFVPAAELWVSNFFTLYLEKVIKQFSLQALPTGWRYFKLKNKHKKMKQEGRQNYPLVGTKAHKPFTEFLLGHSQLSHPRLRQGLGWQLLETP